MKAAETKSTATPAKKDSPFFSKDSEQDFFGSNYKERPFFNKSNNGTGSIQPKLTIGQPGDVYEKEADAMADKVVQRISEHNPPSENKNGNSIQTKSIDETTSITPFVQTKCATCEQEEKLQKKEGEDESDLLHGKLQKKPIFESNTEPPDDKNIQRKCSECEIEEKKNLQTKSYDTTSATASQSTENSLTSSKGMGSPLPENTRTQMESSFGADFSNVRIHTDSSAVQMSKDLNAQAFTHGSNIYFNSGKYDASSYSGKHLLAHELTHTVQQGGTQLNSGFHRFSIQRVPETRIMRKLLFESSVQICRRHLETRNFKISEGGVRIVLLLSELDKTLLGCQDHDFWVTLTRSEGWWPDDDISICKGQTGGNRLFSIGGLSPGTYYLEIDRAFDHRNCCLEGEIFVFDEPISSDHSSCERDTDSSAMDIVHGALDIVGFIPILGAIPDGVNAIIYVLEGDWANVGLSAVAMVPAWGDGVKLSVMAGKSVIKISEKAATKIGKEGLAKGLKEVKAASKVAGSGAKAATRFKTFREFKKVYGEAGPGKAWHHIVEQNPGNISKFGGEQIHNIDNLIKLPHGKGTVHAKVSGYFSSKQPFTGGKTVREWLNKQSYQEQYDFGIKILKQFGGNP